MHTITRIKMYFNILTAIMVWCFTLSIMCKNAHAEPECIRCDTFGEVKKEEPVVREPIKESYQDGDKPIMIITDARYCTQYIVQKVGPFTNGIGQSMVLRVDRNGKPALAKRCVPEE